MLAATAGLLLAGACRAPLPQAPGTPLPLPTAGPEKKPEITPTPIIAQYSPTPAATDPQPRPTPVTLAVPPVSPFGIESTTLDDRGGLDQIVGSGAHWVRRNALLWSEVEPTQGARNWDALQDLERELANAAAHGLEVILVVRSTPPWAQKVPGSFCGPIRAESLGDFAQFMAEVVARYSAPPVHVKYWELWNEPDVDPSLVPPNSVFGCWGDPAASDYGGAYYAEMLKAVYPALKQANPEAQLLVGGLLLDCDPRSPPAGKDCTPARFLEGILEAGGGPYFDGVSFHAYDHYYGAEGEYANSNWASSWNSTGPVLAAKHQYLVELLTRYDQPSKFLVSSETAILCGGSGKEPFCLDAEFAKTKAYYVAQVMAASVAHDLKALLWYSLHGWRGSELVNSTYNEPTPAMMAFRFANAQLGAARFQRIVDEFPEVRGYAFEREGRRMMVLWSTADQAVEVPFNDPPRTVYDVFGNLLPPSQVVAVGRMPIFLLWKDQ